MYGIGVVKFGEKQIGYIEKNSWDWGGVKPEKVEVEAEQVPGAPVLTLVTKNGTIAPTFNLGTEGAYTGWKAPTELVELRDKCEIKLKSGQTVRIPNATLMGNLGGKLTLTEVSKIECQLTVNAPAGGGSPYEVVNTEPGE